MIFKPLRNRDSIKAVIFKRQAPGFDILQQTLQLSVPS